MSKRVFIVLLLLIFELKLKALTSSGIAADEVYRTEYFFFRQ